MYTFDNRCKCRKIIKSIAGKMSIVSELTNFKVSIQSNLDLAWSGTWKKSASAWIPGKMQINVDLSRPSKFY